LCDDPQISIGRGSILFHSHESEEMEILMAEYVGRPHHKWMLSSHSLDGQSTCCLWHWNLELSHLVILLTAIFSCFIKEGIVLVNLH
jgi:hypothetical protein